MDFVKSRTNRKNDTKEPIIARKLSTTDDLMNKEKPNVSQMTLFSGRRKSSSQPDLNRISQPDLNRISQPELDRIDDSRPSNINLKELSMNSSKSSGLRIQNENLKLSATGLDIIEPEESISPIPIKIILEEPFEEAKPRVFTYKLNEVQSHEPQPMSAPVPSYSRTSAEPFDTNYRKKAVMNRLTLDLSNSSTSFASSSLLRNPEYRRTIAVMDANLNIHKFSPTSHTPPPQIQLPTPGKRDVSRTPSLNPDKILPTLNSVVLDKFASYEEPSFVSIDILDAHKSKESLTGRAFFKVFRSNVPFLIKIFVFLLVITSAASLSMLNLYGLTYYSFLPVLFLVSCLISNVLFFTIDLPKSFTPMKELCSSYPMLLSLLIGSFCGLVASGSIAWSNYTDPWIYYVLYLLSGCTAISIFTEIMFLSLLFNLSKSLKSEYSEKIEMIIEFCINLRKKLAGAKLDLYDNFFSRLLFSELSQGHDRLTRKSMFAYSQNDAVFKTLNLYENDDITENELTESIAHILKFYQYEVEERKAIFAACQKMQSIFFRFGLFCNIIVLSVGLIGFPVGFLILFFGLVASPVLLRQILICFDNTRVLARRHWHIGNYVQFGEICKLITFNFYEAQFESKQGLLIMRYPFTELIILNHFSASYCIQGKFNKDSQYLIYKGLNRKTHRFVNELQIEKVSENSLKISFYFKQAPRNCLIAIEEVLKKYELDYESIETL